MPRIKPIDPSQAKGKLKTLFEGFQKAYGMTPPNIMTTMAHSPAVLEAFLNFNKAMGTSSLSSLLREQIAVAISGVNACEYCASSHSFLAKMLKLDEEELDANLQGLSRDPKVQTALKFSQSVVLNRGWVDNEEVQRVRDAGYSEAELVEIIAAVAITIFTNYFNHIAQTEVDFPLVTVGEAVTN